MRNWSISTVLALAITLFFWSSAFPAIRYAITPLGPYGPGELALLRFIVATVFLGIGCLFTGARRPEICDLPGIAGLGLCGIAIYHFALNWGEITVSAGVACLIVNMSPVFTALLATAFMGERLTGWGWAGIATSFLGIVLIGQSKEGGLHFEPGALAVLVSACAGATYFVFQKPYLKKYGAMPLTTYVMAFGTVALLLFLPGLITQLKQAPLRPTLAVVYLGVFPAGLAYALWAYILARVPASVAAPFMYLMPPLAFLIAWVGLGERPAALSVTGGAIAIAGVIILNVRGRAATIPVPSPKAAAAA